MWSWLKSKFAAKPPPLPEPWPTDDDLAVAALRSMRDSPLRWSYYECSWDRFVECGGVRVFADGTLVIAGSRHVEVGCYKQQFRDAFVELTPVRLKARAAEEAKAREITAAIASLHLPTTEETK